MSGKKNKFQDTAVLTAPRGSLLNVLSKSDIIAPVIKSNVITLSLVLFVCSFLLYANTLQNDYALDDIIVLSKNAFVIKGIKGIPEILSTPHLRGYIIAANETYRPLSLVFFAIEYEVFGANPLAGHFFNVVFFGLCVVLLFLFLDNLFDKKKTIVAFIAAMLFAAHPIHTEIVNNIKSFDELLCFFFAFLSLNLFIKYSEDGKKSNLLIGILFIFLSLISKETSIAFMLIIPLVFFFYKNENKRRSVYISAGALLAAIAFVGIRWLVLKEYNDITPDHSALENALVNAPDRSSATATTILVMGRYIQFMFIPYPLVCDYSFNSIPYASFKETGVWLSLVVYCLLIFTAMSRLNKFKKDPWAFGILFFLLAIALFSNLFFLLGSEMSERFTFFASVGFCLLVGLALEKWIKKSQGFTIKSLMGSKVWLILLPVLMAFSFITFSRNKEWKDSYTLYRSDVEKEPQNAHLTWCVGNGLILEKYETEKDPVAKKVILEEGIGYLRRSLAISPNFLPAQLMIANAYSTEQKYDSAELHYKVALSINPHDLNTLNNMAGIYFAKHDFSGALAMSLKVISIEPNYMIAYSNAGLCYYNLHQFDQGIVYLHKAINLDPGYGRSYETLARTYNVTGKTDSTQKYKGMSQKTNPGFKL